MVRISCILVLNTIQLPVKIEFNFISSLNLYGWRSKTANNKTRGLLELQFVAVKPKIK